MIISVVNLKGGAGKTTVATNLVYAFSRKFKTLLIDTDQQRSASQWFANREKEEENISVVSIIEDKSLKKQLPFFRSQYERIVIDGAPQVDLINAVNIFHADLVLIPVTPSPYDIWATESIVERVKTAMSLQEKKKACFVLNRVNDQTALSRDAAAALESLDFPVLETRLHNRVVYADSANSGLSVLEASNPKAKAEFQNFYNDVEKIIGKD